MNRKIVVSLGIVALITSIITIRSLVETEFVPQQDFPESRASDNVNSIEIRPSALTEAGETVPGEVAIVSRDPYPVTYDDDVPALPGLSGYNVTNPMIARSENPAVQLVEEQRDLSWAPGMETSLMNEIQAVSIDAPMTMLEVQCRTTWCGAVIGLPPGEDRHSRIRIGDQLRDTFDFQRISRVGFGRRDGSSFVAIYLKADRQPGDPSP